MPAYAHSDLAGGLGVQGQLSSLTTLVVEGYRGILEGRSGLPGLSGMNDTGLVQGMRFDQEDRQKQTRLDKATDEVLDRFSRTALRQGSALHNEGKPPCGDRRGPEDWAESWLWQTQHRQN
ncbi:MAG: hypothetical protein ACLQNE_27105 [Thermoguttaceae bacterium]|jgi:hypothetical protein